MLTKLKAALTATMLSSVALVPVTVVGYVASADVAVAKSDKAGGNGNGGGKGNGGKSASAKSKGKSGEPHAFRGNGHGKGNGNAIRGNGAANGKRGLAAVRHDFKRMGDDVRGLFRKVTGQKPIKTRPARTITATRSSGGPKISRVVAAIDGDVRPALRGRPNYGTLHASHLGNMNGALNANSAAIAAKLRNGNTNGPVGLMAAYVAGRAITADAIDGLGPDAGDYILLNHVLADEGYVDENDIPDLDAYLASGDMNEEIDTILDGFTVSAQDQLLIDNGFVDGDGNPDRIAYLDSGTEIEGFDDATDFDPALYDDVNNVNDDLFAAKIAEDNLVTYWNKGDGADEVKTDALRDALATRALDVEESPRVIDALAPIVDGDIIDDDPYYDDDDHEVEYDDDDLIDPCDETTTCVTDGDVVVMKTE